MEYNEAMRYLMEGVKEARAAEEKNGFESSAEYEADYQSLTQLEADVEVYEKKLKDYKQLKVKENEEVEKMIKKLAALQIEKDEMNSLSWAKICSVFSGKYEKRRAALDNDSLFAQVEMNNIKLNLQNLDRKIAIITKVLSETKKAFKAKRAYMRERYGENHRYEEEIGHKNMHLKTMIKEIDEAVAAINRIMGQGEKAIDNIDSVDSWEFLTDAIAPYSFVGTLVGEAMIFGRSADARDQLFLVTAMVPEVVKEIEDVIEAYRKFRSEYKDENPENELENEEDMDPPMEFIRINMLQIKDRGCYYQDDLDELFGRLNVIKNNLRKERSLVSKQIKK